MASVKVAVRVRPFNQRELDMGAKGIIQMNGNKTGILNSKANARDEHIKYKEFTFDFSYWSHDEDSACFASQEQVYNDLGTEVVDCAFEGYNACVFAYGQTGSGKTYTMMGSGESQGLIPRICKALFSRMEAGKQLGTSYRTEVSYLEIYQERVMDLLHPQPSHSLRVREHPRKGPYVQDLTTCFVTDYAHIQECMLRGNTHRTTASTNMNDVSSRSHAIFTITFVQAGFSNGMPSETVSKIHLVDLAGSERADATGATGTRLKEGAHINKSLVTLGSVISALAELSSLEARDQRPKSTFIPYRDSVLTWLLKDSLGGNSKTIMIAAISPADCNYGETLSTLRYANRAKNIINKPTVNEDPNVKLIRELREEISKLKALMHNELNTSHLEPQVLAQLHEKEAQEKFLTEEWTEKWRETQKILQEQKTLGLRKSGLGVVLDSDMPHLVGIDDDLLSTGVTLYHLKEGETMIGSDEAEIQQDIILNGSGIENQHCSIVLDNGIATLHPKASAQCWVNTIPVDKPTKLSQGCLILLGRTNMFRYNDPVEAAKLRKAGSKSQLNLSRMSLLSWSTNDLACSTENLNAGDEYDLESQRLELIKEKETFEQEQLALKENWQKEQEVKKKALEDAQKKLEEERRVMEFEHELQCKKLEEDWKRLEAQKEERDRELKEKEVELVLIKESLEKEKALYVKQVFEDLDKVEDLSRIFEDKLKNACKFFISYPHIFHDAQTLSLLQNIYSKNELSDEDKSSIINIFINSKDDSSLKDDINKHKKELSDLQLEIESKMVNVSECKKQLENLDTEIICAIDKQTILAGEDKKEEMEAAKEDVLRRTQEQMKEIIDRKKSLTLNLKKIAVDNNNGDALSPMKTAETFHTANSNSADMNKNEMVQSFLSDSGVDVNNAQIKAKPKTPDDESDLSSTEDYGKRQSDENSTLSSSSLDQTFSFSLRRRFRNRPFREEDAVRAMKKLFQKITKQKALIMQNLETDGTKEELNSQIAVLQELQQQYMTLNIALQHPFQPSPSLRDDDPTSPNNYLSPANEHPLQDILDSHMNRYSSTGSNPMLCGPEQQRFLISPSGGLTPYSHNFTRSMPSIAFDPDYDSEALVSVSNYVLRGTGTKTHYEYEVRICTVDDRWTVYRRYQRFLELHRTMKSKFGDKVAAIEFPSKRLFPNTESVACQRKRQLEVYLRRLLNTVSSTPSSSLYQHRDQITKLALLNFSTFFRKGVFENGKYGTG